MKKPKIRVPVAPPGIRHKSEKDYDRKDKKKSIDESSTPKK